MALIMNQHSYVSLICLIFMLFSCFFYSSCAYNQLIVGGRDGWVSNPSENYNHWAGRLRFQVNDTLLFKYNKGLDSVVEVNKDDYDKCNTNTTNPIRTFNDGNSVFTFDRSGPFYFITGNKTNCDKGQKLVIVVVAVRNGPMPTSPPSIAPVPAAAGPSSEPPATGNAPSASGPSANSSTPGNGGGGGGSGGSATGNTPADVAPPPQRSFATAAYAPSVIMVSAVSILLSVGLGGFIVV